MCSENLLSQQLHDTCDIFHLPSVASGQIKNPNDIISMYASAPETPPRLVSRPCRALTANGRSKWPIAQPLCNCDQISHGSSNPIRPWLCVLRSLRSMMDACLRNANPSHLYKRSHEWRVGWLLVLHISHAVFDTTSLTVHTCVSTEADVWMAVSACSS